MSNDEHVFLSDSLKDIIDLTSLEDTFTKQKTNELKYIDSDAYLLVKFIDIEEPIVLEVFQFKKNKNFTFKMLEIKTNTIIQFLNQKIESVLLKINETQYTNFFHCDNYNILYSMQYNMKDNYKLTIKIKSYEDVL